MTEFRINKFDNLVVVMQARPVIEFRIVRLEKGEDVQRMDNSFPAYYDSEEEIKQYLDACGENYEVVEDDEQEQELFKEIEEKISTTSPYSVIYDSSNSEWKSNPELNKLFIQAQERFANHKLRRDGYLLLNDVYELLRFPRTSVGAIVGWMFEGDGDGYIDFQMQDLGGNKIRLDFNVDGVMYDKIDSSSVRSLDAL